MVTNRNRNCSREIEQVQTNKQALFTTFLLIGPSFLMAAMVAVGKSIGLSIGAIIIFAYQAIMIKNYVDKNKSY